MSKRRPEQNGFGKRTATIDDVARKAGVSKGTVSHVINGKASVSPALRSRVQSAIAALDFRPAQSGRSLTARKLVATPDHTSDASIPRLTTIGYVSVDFTAALDRLPAREERRIARTINKTIGGPAANVAAVAAGIGAPYPLAASLITSIGADEDSDWAISELSSRRVRLLCPSDRRDGRMNRALVLVESDGRRTIVNEPIAWGSAGVDQAVAAIEPAGLTWALHVEGYQLPTALETVRAARQRGFVVSMQATGLSRGWLAQNHLQLLRDFDVVMLHRETLEDMGLSTAASGRIPALAARIASLGSEAPCVTLVTLGDAGAAAIERGGQIHRAPALNVEVVDTTGAGDAFMGAFLACWLNGAAIADSLRLACAAGSLQVTGFGAQEIRPTAAVLHEASGLRMPSSSSMMLPRAIAS